MRQVEKKPVIIRRSTITPGARDSGPAMADAALAAIIAMVGLGQLIGPQQWLPVLSPREVAPRLAVAVLVAHGSLAIGGWAIDLHNGLLQVVTPSTLVGFDPGAWAQSGPGGLLLGLLYALLGLLLALGGWLRLALVDVLLIAAPLLAVLWVLPLTAGWAEWALGLFGNLLAGQRLQVLALWLRGQLHLAPSPDLQTAIGKNFAAVAVLLVALLGAEWQSYELTWRSRSANSFGCVMKGICGAFISLYVQSGLACATAAGLSKGAGPCGHLM